MKKGKQQFFTAAEEQEIITAIKQAEKQTSGEIRVHIESDCKGEVKTRVTQLFRSLGMEKTEYRNAVLFYMAVNNNQFYILGDKGIYQAVPKGFWEDTKELMMESFQKNQFKQGLIDGILKAGTQLKKYFPYHENDRNELPDEISYQ